MLLDPRRASAGVMICEDMNPDPFVMKASEGALFN